MSGVTDPTSPYYGYVEPVGIVVPDDATLITAVQGEWTGAFGAGLSLNSATPQGAMIAADTLARSGVLQTNAVVANQINPNVSGGVFLDALCALLGLGRAASTYTIAPGVILSGVGGSPIAAGTLAATPVVAGVGGDKFATLADVAIDALTGLASVTMVAVQPGPIPAPAGAWRIVYSVLGWETVTNPAIGIIGLTQQPDETLRTLRNNTLAMQGSGFVEAATSAISNVIGVLSFRSLENVTDATVIIDGITLKPHSVWYCVDGGTLSEVALALLIAKGGGANWNGATIMPTVEPISTQLYQVAFDVPQTVEILVRVTCSQAKFVGDPYSEVTAAVIAFGQNAITGVAGFSLGDDASPFEIANGIIQYCPGLKVSKVEVAPLNDAVFSTLDLPMQINQKPVISIGNVAVVVTL